VTQGGADISAAVARAFQHERDGRAEEGLRLLQQAAHAGDACAQAVLGGRLLVGHNAPRLPDRGARWVTLAAGAGNPDALVLSAKLSAVGCERPQDWRAALGFLQAAADRGHPLAQQQRAQLGAPDAFDLAAWLAPPAARMQFESPRVGVIERFLPAPFCAWLVGRARPGLMPAAIVDGVTGRLAASRDRTNSNAHFPFLDTDIIVLLAQARIAAALGAPASHLEPPSVLNYQVGQLFDAHYDFLDPAEAGYAAELAALGQRTATFLVYLNDGFEGGDTHFPKLDWAYRGGAGDAVFFWNASPAGAVERTLLHAGRAPTRGEKWLFSQWVRDRPVPLT
jgi:hypothetical protein